MASGEILQNIILLLNEQKMLPTNHIGNLPNSPLINLISFIKSVGDPHVCNFPRAADNEIITEL